MADYGGRMLWMYIMPGLTGDLLLDVADDLGFEIKFRFSTLTDEQYSMLEEGCRRRLGLPVDWDSDVSERSKSTAIRHGWGDLYGTGT